MRKLDIMFFGGYQDVTHTVHALYISRYPMGREATLNYPSIDNRFRNDTPNGVLIRTSVSGTGPRSDGRLPHASASHSAGTSCSFFG